MRYALAGVAVFLAAKLAANVVVKAVVRRHPVAHHHVIQGLRNQLAHEEALYRG